jgi:hypothetical protein
MDDKAQQIAPEAQDAQNAAMVAFLKLIASLIGQASEREVKLEDLTLMSGTKKAWPSDNPDLELTAKIQDAFTNAESKASVRIFLEYADGTKEEIFRQTAGKVVKDPLGLAPAMREMFAKQAADKFTAQQRPKVIIEADTQTVTANTSKQDKPKVLGKNGVETENGTTVFEKLAETVPIAPIKLDKAKPINNAAAADSVEQAETVQPSEEKERILKAKLAEVEKSLLQASKNLDSPDFDTVETQNWVDYFEEKAQSFRAQLGITEPTAVAQDTATVEAAQVQLVDTEAVAEPESLQSNEEKKQNFILTEIAASQVSDLTAVTPSSLDEDNEANVQPSLEALKATPSIQEQNEMFILGAIASSGAMLPLQESAVQESPALATVPNAKPIVYESWIPAFPELAEVSTLANYEGQTLDITPVNTSSSDLAAPSDIEGAFNHVALQPFLAEVSQLSTQIESLREQTNQKLSELAAFSQTIKETVIEPKLEQWSQQTIAVVETQAVSIGDRLKDAVTNLRDTVKERAANDWKIVVDTVKERASEDWSKAVDAVKSKASGDFETLQKWAIGSDKVDKGIDTLIDYVGQKHPNGGMAQMDGYTFIHKNGQTGIFKDSATEPVYKNGLLTDKANSKDAAYIAQFPQKAQNAAAAVDAYKASQSAQSSAAPSQSQGAGVSRGR